MVYNKNFFNGFPHKNIKKVVGINYSAVDKLPLRGNLQI